MNTSTYSDQLENHFLFGPHNYKNNGGQFAKLKMQYSYKWLADSLKGFAVCFKWLAGSSKWLAVCYRAVRLLKWLADNFKLRAGSFNMAGR